MKKVHISAKCTNLPEHSSLSAAPAADYGRMTIILSGWGMGMPGRGHSMGGGYRYGFNGKENDNEVKGEGNQQDYGMRFYDPRLGRFLSVDPLDKKYPELTPYQFASNTPIAAIDLDGLEKFIIIRYYSSDILYKSRIIRISDEEIKQRGYDATKVAIISVHNEPKKYYDVSSGDSRFYVIGQTVRSREKGDGIVPLENRNNTEKSLDKIPQGQVTNVAQVDFVEIQYKGDETAIKGRLTETQTANLKKMATLTTDGVTTGPMEVTGNTSDRATNYKSNKVSPDNNQKLSEDRAEVAKKYIMKAFNLPTDKVEAKGVGSTQPKPNTNPSDNSNQRTTIQVGIILN